MTQKISCIIPVYNEAANIDQLYRRLRQALNKDFHYVQHEIIFVDDGSSDGTFEALARIQSVDPSVAVLQFSRNFGHHIAITAGLDMAEGDVVVMMDGDLQDQPEEIIKLYRKLQDGYDVVYAERKKKRFHPIKRCASYFFNMVIRQLIHEPIVVNSTIFRIMTKQVVDNIRLLREHNRYIVGIIGWVGFRHAPQEVEHGTRYAGKSKYDFSKQVALALNAIFSFSRYPLRLIMKIGLSFVALSFVFACTIIYRKIMYNTPVAGWSSLIVSLLCIGGIQIIILGVIAEYLGRSYMEIKNRPLYVIRQYLHDSHS